MIFILFPDSSVTGQTTPLYIIENLAPQTNYNFRFSASNIAGRGSWGSTMTFSTTMRDVPGYVKFLVPVQKEYAASQYHDRFNLKWGLTPDNGEMIDYYEIKWCETRKYTDHWELQDSTCQSTPVTKREFLIRSLKPDTYYRMEVRAHNALGYGPPSNITVRTTRGKEE